MTISIDGAANTITGLAVDGLPAGTVGTATLAAAAVTPVKQSQPLTLGTAIATTSGTSHDFTGIPSWVKRITVICDGVSTNGISIPQIQIGSGSIDAASYLGSAFTANTNNTANSTGFLLGGTSAAVYARHGHVVLTLIGSNKWGCSVTLGDTNTAVHVGGGSKTLSGTLDRIRLTTVNGTDTFDAGSINIMYEG